MRWILIAAFVFLTSCGKREEVCFEPHVTALPHPKECMRQSRLGPLPTSFETAPFAPLSPEEKATGWGQEWTMGLVFAADFDLYRAITCFKRALILLPQESTRRVEIHYDIALAYYLGQKYTEVLYTVNGTELFCVTADFPAFPDLLLILYDSYSKLGYCEEAEHIAQLIDQKAPSLGYNLTFFRALEAGDFPKLYEFACDEKLAYVGCLLDSYRGMAKSIEGASFLNAICPGAGYWYVGMRQTACTALLINSLFIGAAVYFIEHGNGPAAIITLSLESGWYIGGIYGGALAAKAYNENLYDQIAQKIACQSALYPLFMLRYTF